jgi:hypothetical protein
MESGEMHFQLKQPTREQNSYSNSQVQEYLAYAINSKCDTEEGSIVGGICKSPNNSETAAQLRSVENTLSKYPSSKSRERDQEES